MSYTDMDVAAMKGNANEAADLLKVMAHPERLMVLCQLTQGEVGVGKLQRTRSLANPPFHST